VLDDVKSWNGKKDLFLNNHTELQKHVDVNTWQFHYIDVKYNEQCQRGDPWPYILSQQGDPWPAL
jgi:hypothetical protein